MTRRGNARAGTVPFADIEREFKAATGEEPAPRLPIAVTLPPAGEVRSVFTPGRGFSRPCRALVFTTFEPERVGDQPALGIAVAGEASHVFEEQELLGLPDLREAIVLAYAAGAKDHGGDFSQARAAAEDAYQNAGRLQRGGGR